MKKFILLSLALSFISFSCGNQYKQGDTFEYKTKTGNNLTIKVESSNLSMWTSTKGQGITKKLSVVVTFKNEDTKEIQINAENKFIEADNQVIGNSGASNWEDLSSSNQSVEQMLQKANDLNVKPGLSKTINFRYELPANPNTDINLVWGSYKGKDEGFDYKVSLTPKVETYTN